MSAPDSAELPYDIAEAERALAAADPRVAWLIAQTGPAEGRLRMRTQDTVPALVRAIVGQQLSTKAAATIHGRVRELLDGDVTAEALLSQPDDALRGCGLSRAKTAAVQDLARKSLDGTVPARAALAAMPDDEVVRRLTAVRGVGPWTAEMFLLFTLGRPDVWAAGDLGLREGLRILTAAEERPTPKEFAAAGAPYRPWRSVLSWHLWRATELPAGARPPMA